MQLRIIWLDVWCHPSNHTLTASARTIGSLAFTLRDSAIYCVISSIMPCHGHLDSTHPRPPKRTEIVVKGCIPTLRDSAIYCAISSIMPCHRNLDSTHPRPPKRTEIVVKGCIPTLRDSAIYCAISSIMPCHRNLDSTHPRPPKRTEIVVKGCIPLRSRTQVNAVFFFPFE